MPEHIPYIRIFVSSPGDVSHERRTIRTIVEELNKDPAYREKMNIEIVAWDDPDADVVMPATIDPQAAIDAGMHRPSECAVVITIFWGRMGSQLNEKYKKPDGTPYWSGTEWEYWDARRGYEANQNGLPIIYVYRRIDDPPFPTPRKGQDQDDAFIEHGTQRKRIKTFFAQFRDAETGAFEGYYHEYETVDGFVDLAKRHIRTLVNHAHRILTGQTQQGDSSPDDVQLEWDIKTDGSPFPGLKSFEARHEKVYFGRAREVADVLKRIATNRLQVIVGASGSGKSSLVKAGVLPKLRANALPPSARWHQVTMRPASAPFAALHAALQAVFPPALVDSAETLANAPENLHRMLERLSQGEETVLFIDQFEELFTSAKDDAAAFIAMLRYPSAYLRVLVTIRSDFYDVLLTHFEKELRESTFTLAKPSALALVEMIASPAEVSGLTFEEGVVERIVEDAGTDAGSLALIAYMLDELYNAARMRGQSTLTQADYKHFGGVQKVIGTRAEQIFKALRLTDPEKTLQRVFHALVTVDERSTRQSAERRLFTHDPEAERLIDAFVEARLFTSDKGYIEVAHEALLREWTLLAEWIARSREQRMMIARMQREAGIWQERGKPDHLRPNAETLKDFQEACGALGIDPRSLGIEDFIEPEQHRLLRELEALPRDDTSHERRRDIGDRLAVIGDTRDGVGVKEGVPDMLWLPVAPGGELTIDDKHDFTVQPFYVAKYLVTYPQFQAFVDAEDGFNDLRWWDGMPDEYKLQRLDSQRTKVKNAPRDTVSWYQCVAFARWLNHKLQGLRLPHPGVGTRPALSVDDAEFVIGENAEIRLPTEWEWQWMAQGGALAKAYPWGDWQVGYANASEAGLNRTTAVGMYPHGRADCGALDMAGNLLEWCMNDKANPHIINGYSNQQSKVLRGGSFYSFQDLAAASYRYFSNPSGRNRYFGLRLAVCPMRL